MDTAHAPVRPEGLSYLKFLRALHTRVRPDWYLEIGTFRGRSLRFVQGNYVAIDPSFRLGEPAPLPGRNAIFFQDTSDAFFESDVAKLLKGRIDMAFLDGLHHYEVLLRDFMNVEPMMAEGGLVLMHDCLPTTAAMTTRDITPGEAWTGDVWKTLLILQETRPDLRIEVLDCAPTGLVLIRDLAPRSTKLRRDYDDIVAAWGPRQIEDFDGGLEGFYSRIALTDAQGVLASL